MKSKKIQYGGNTIFKINFGLYGYEDINFFKSKVEIKNAFENEYKNLLIKNLNKIGLKYCGLKYYSPKEYNFNNDSLDLTIRIINKDLFKKYILKYKEDINKALNKNNSYDGYMALTINDFEEDINNMNKPFYEPDILVLSVILNKLITFDFDINDYIVFEEEDL